MKKYNIVILVSIALWLVISIIFGGSLWYLQARGNKAYRVDINRIQNALYEGHELSDIDLDEYDTISKVDILSAKEQNTNKIEEFYKQNYDYPDKIMPLIINGEISEYVKYTYIPYNQDIYRITFILELSLAVMEIAIVLVLLYMKKHVLSPFDQLVSVPYDLAKGHLNGEIIEEKSKYFGKFMWGISALRDSINLARHKEFRLLKEKKVMLMSLSHDIKTPLNTIRLYARAMETGMYNEEKSKYAAHQIGEKTKEIENYVNEIMKASREDVIDISVNMGEFYLEELINKVNKTYYDKCKIRHIYFEVEKYENKLIKGDMDKTLEVIENIMENAFKYGDGKKITLSTYEEEDCTLLKIYNTGNAVNDNDINHIFDSFFRGRNGEGKQGEGLGLYICRAIMNKMQGEIFAQIEEDGMSFILVFKP